MIRIKRWSWIKYSGNTLKISLRLRGDNELYGTDSFPDGAQLPGHVKKN
jgi:hypothetical protein